MIKCRNCGAVVKEKAFCPECGVALPIQPKGKVNNQFIKILWWMIAVQILLFVASMYESAVSGLCFIAFLISFIPAFAISICCIAKGKRIDVRKGEKLGVISTVINSIGLIIALLLVISFQMFNGESIAFEKEINKGVDNSAQIAVEDLRDSLKDPSSLQINRIAAEIYDTRITWKDSDGVIHDDEPFKGQYKIYIDYTAKKRT